MTYIKKISGKCEYPGPSDYDKTDGTPILTYCNKPARYYKSAGYFGVWICDEHFQQKYPEIRVGVEPNPTR